MCIRDSAWPVPFAVQGVVYLEDTSADMGALRVVPGFRERFAAWSAARGDREPPLGAASPTSEGLLRAGSADAVDPALRAVAAAGRAGDLVLWHTLAPHGPARNVGRAPRVSAYVAMLPVDARPFLGARRAPDAPLWMDDAGTLAYHASCLLYTSPSPRDQRGSRMPSSA